MWFFRSFFSFYHYAVIYFISVYLYLLTLMPFNFFYLKKNIHTNTYIQMRAQILYCSWRKWFEGFINNSRLRLIFSKSIFICITTTCFFVLAFIHCYSLVIFCSSYFFLFLCYSFLFRLILLNFNQISLNCSNFYFILNFVCYLAHKCTHRIILFNK